MATATDLEPNQNPPASKDEGNFRQGGLSKWMTGLKDALPNPSLTGTSDEPEPKPIDPPIPAPATPPAQPNPPAAPPATPPAAPAKPATPPAPAAEERWPRSAKEWKAFTEARNTKFQEYEKQIQERDGKIKEYEAKAGQTITPEVQKEIDLLKKENETYSHQLRLLSVTTHPKFKQYFESKINATLNQLKSFIQPTQLEEVSRLIQLPDSEEKNNKINEMLVGMSPIQQGRLFSVISGLDAIRAERDSEINRAQQDYEQMMAQAKTQKEREQAQFGKTIEDTIKAFQDPKTGRPEYQAREGETEWNEAVKRRIETAKQLITGNLSHEAMFKAAFDAAAYADVLLSYKATLGENEKLKTQVAAMTAANPKVEPGARRTETGTTEPPMPKDARPMDFTKRWVQQFGQAMRGTQE